MFLKIFALISLYNLAAYVTSMSDDSEVSNRRAATGGDFSFVARIERAGELVCNGFLVDKDYVVTLSRCINIDYLHRYKVYFRSKYYDVDNEEEMRTLESASIADENADDVILVKLNEITTRRTHNVRPFFRFSSSEAIDMELTDCKSIGFNVYGRSITLDEVDINRIPSKYCPGSDADQTFCFNTENEELCPGSRKSQPLAVAFSAGITNNLFNLSGEVVVYDRVFANIGNGYNPTSGKFTCPYAGSYNFQFHALSGANEYAWLEMYQNDKYIVSNYGVAGYATGANSVVLTLQRGDKVYNWVRYADLDGATDEVYATFSGHLLHV